MTGICGTMLLMSKTAAYSPSIFNAQRLLFAETDLVANAPKASVPEDYYQHGWTVLDGIADEQEAVAAQESLIGSIDAERLPLHERFHDRIQLAKADQIPVCDDIVTTSYQVLHFDMGHPFLESDEQLLVTHVGLYLPKTTTHRVTARTRLVELDGLVSPLELSASVIEQKVVEYVRCHGDGWDNHNTFRLACFARFIDALAKAPELETEIDKTVGQWFQSNEKLDADDAYQQEVSFYGRHGIDLSGREVQIALEPGQLLVLDNTRVIHGRIGQRKAKEVYNFMFGIESIERDDITALRQSICELV